MEKNKTFSIIKDEVIKQRIEGIVNNDTLKKGLVKYLKIRKNFEDDNYHICDDNSKNPKGNFQKDYKSFYKMNKKTVKNLNKFSIDYFNTMDNLKKIKKEKKYIDFQTVYDEVYKFQDNNELSFTSKLAHTINNNLPIWDSIVATKHFGYNKPNSSLSNVYTATINIYKAYQEDFYNYMKSPEGKLLIDLFDEMFKKEFKGEKPISDVKKIDFILWQYRPWENKNEKK